MDAVNSSGQRTRPMTQVRSSAAFNELSTSAAELSWRQRYEHLLEANHRLQEKLEQLDIAHRKSLTVVKYEPTLPNNDVFTMQLVEENRQLLARYRALELRLLAKDGKAVTSPRRSIDKNRATTTSVGKKTPRSARERLPVKNHGVQTEISTAKALQGSTSSSQSASPGTKRKDSDEPPEQSPQPVQPEVVALVAELKLRLSDLHLDLDRLRKENDLLRSERDEQEENDGLRRNTHKWEELQAQLRTKREQEELENILRDRVRQMTVLEAQYLHLQDRMKTQAQVHQQSVSRIEQLTVELFDAKQTILKQADALQTDADHRQQIRLLEREVHLLRSENSTLNEAVAALTARPLESLDALLEKKSIQLAMLEDDKSKLERQLHKANQDHRVVVQVADKLRRRVEELVAEVEGLQKERQQLASSYEECKASREIAELQLQYYMSGDHDESKEFMEAVGRSLAQMRRPTTGDQTRVKDTTTTSRQFLNDKVDPPTVGQFQRERIEKMADLSKLIQEDVRAQMQDMRVSHQAEIRALGRQLRVWKERAQQCEQEMTELMNDRDTSATRRWTKQPTSREKPPPPLSVREAAASEKFQETLMEVRIDRLQLELVERPQSRTHEQATRSMLLFCDFFDFEPQHSPVFQVTDGAHVPAPIEMEIGFKLLIDQAFCRSPASECLTVELHELKKGKSQCIGTGVVSMDMLFLSVQGKTVLSVKLLDLHSNAPVGSCRLSATLSQPVNRLFSTWKREWKPSLTIGRLGLDPSSLNDPQVRVSIRVCCFVVTHSPESGDVSVKYRFMGHPSVRAMASSKKKVYGFSYFTLDRMTMYELPRDDSLLKYLDTYELALAMETSRGQPIGSCSVPLKLVAQAIQSSRDTASIVSATITTNDGDERVPRPVGKVWVEIDVDTPSTVGLSYKELRPVIMRVFGTGDRTLIDWMAFCLAMTMSASERACRDVLVSKCQSKSQSLDSICGSSLGIRSIDALKTVLEAVDIQLSQSEWSLLSGTLVSDSGVESSNDVVDDGGAAFEKHLQLLVKTSDDVWLRIESTLRRRVHTLNVAIEYASQDGQSDRIDWETFAYRIRLKK